jgi:hypothetical protein
VWKFKWSSDAAKAPKAKGTHVYCTRELLFKSLKCGKRNPEVEVALLTAVAFDAA